MIQIAQTQMRDYLEESGIGEYPLDRMQWRKLPRGFYKTELFTGIDGKSVVVAPLITSQAPSEEGTEEHVRAHVLSTTFYLHDPAKFSTKLMRVHNFGVFVPKSSKFSQAALDKDRVANLVTPGRANRGQSTGQLKASITALRQALIDAGINPDELPAVGDDSVDDSGTTTE